MKKRLNYRELMEKWMEYYSMSAERSRRMWASILSRLHVSKTKTDTEGEKQNEIYVERADSES